MNLSLLKVLESYDSIIDLEQCEIDFFINVINLITREIEEPLITISSKKDIMILSSTTHRRRYISGYDGIKVCHVGNEIHVRIDKNNLINILKNSREYKIQFYIKDKEELVVVYKNNLT